LTEVSAERDIPVLINIHEVELALDHADRVVGLHDGELVFEGTPAEFDERARDTVYRGMDAPPSDAVDGSERSVADGSTVGEPTRTPAGGS
jgi:phosphonate transport system ATP-binding protein